MSKTVTLAMKADAWSALGTWVAAVAALATMGIAIAAACIGFGQLKEARRTRLQAWKMLVRAGRDAASLQAEQARPFVVAYLEGVEHSQKHTDIVIRNYGRTAAINVRLDIQPTPQVSAHGGVDVVEDLAIPDPIPTLAPGQTWRTLWDFGPARAESDLPQRHAGDLTYTDYRGTPYATPVVLDFATEFARQWVGQPS